MEKHIHLSRLQYISSGDTPRAHFDNILRALQGGIDWVQLRLKGAYTDQEALALASDIAALKQHFPFTFIVNDDVQLALGVDADGVHLGLTDLPVAQAKAILPQAKIVGGTANTLAQVQQRQQEGCDYIGLGPLRYTATKEKLSPILGFAGYASILNGLPATTLPPVFAIGGIGDGDLRQLRELGLHGVALSGAINARAADKLYIDHLKRLLDEHETEYRK